MTAHTSEDIDVHGRLAHELSSTLGVDAVTRGSLDRLKYAHDASHYLLVPQVVGAPASAEQVSELLRACDRAGVPLTFRSAGTSLSGQGLTDSVLVDTRHRFQGIEVLHGGARV